MDSLILLVSGSLGLEILLTYSFPGGTYMYVEVNMLEMYMYVCAGCGKEDILCSHIYCMKLFIPTYSVV